MSESETVEVFSLVAGAGYSDEWLSLDGLTIESSIEAVRAALNAAHNLTAPPALLRVPLYLADKRLADDGLSLEALLASEAKKRLNNGKLKLRKFHENAGGARSFYIIADARAVADSSVAVLGAAAVGGAGAPPLVAAAPPSAAPVDAMTATVPGTAATVASTSVSPVGAELAAGSASSPSTAPTVRDEWYRTADTIAALHLADSDAMKILSRLAMPLLRAAHRAVYGPPSAADIAALKEVLTARRECRHGDAEHALRTWAGLPPVRASGGAGAAAATGAATGAKGAGAGGAAAAPPVAKGSGAGGKAAACKSGEKAAGSAAAAPPVLDALRVPWLPFLHACLWGNTRSNFVLPRLEYLALHGSGTVLAAANAAFTFFPANKPLDFDTVGLWETLATTCTSEKPFGANVHLPLPEAAVHVESEDLAQLEPAVWANAIAFFPKAHHAVNRRGVLSEDGKPKEDADWTTRFFSQPFDPLPARLDLSGLRARSGAAGGAGVGAQPLSGQLSVAQAAKDFRNVKHAVRHRWDKLKAVPEPADVARLILYGIIFANVTRQQWATWMDEPLRAADGSLVVTAEQCAANVAAAEEVIQSLLDVMTTTLMGSPGQHLEADAAEHLAVAVGVHEYDGAGPIRVLIAPPHCSPAGSLVTTDWAAVLDFSDDAAAMHPPFHEYDDGADGDDDGEKAGGAGPGAGAGIGAAAPAAAAGGAGHASKATGTGPAGAAAAPRLRTATSLAAAMTASRPRLVASADSTHGLSPAATPDDYGAWFTACNVVGAGHGRRIFAPFSVAGGSGARSYVRGWFDPKTGQPRQEEWTKKQIGVYKRYLEALAASLKRIASTTQRGIAITLLNFFPYARPVALPHPSRPAFSISGGLARTGADAAHADVDFAYAYFVQWFIQKLHVTDQTQVFVLTDDWRLRADDFTWVIPSEPDDMQLVHVEPARLEVHILTSGRATSGTADGFFLPKVGASIMLVPDAPGAVRTLRTLVRSSADLHDNLVNGGLQFLHRDLPRQLPKPSSMRAALAASAGASSAAAPAGEDLMIPPARTLSGASDVSDGGAGSQHEDHPWLREAALDFALGEPAAWALLDESFLQQVRFKPRIVLPRREELRQKLTDNIHKAQRSALSSASCVYVYVKHEPRVGASTLVRHVLWNRIAKDDGAPCFMLTPRWIASSSASKDAAVKAIAATCAVAKAPVAVVAADRDVPQSAVSDFSDLLIRLGQRAVIVCLLHVKPGDKRLRPTRTTVDNEEDGVEGIGLAKNDVVVKVTGPTPEENDALQAAYDALRRLIAGPGCGPNRLKDGFDCIKGSIFRRIPGFLQFAATSDSDRNLVEKRKRSFLAGVVRKLFQQSESGPESRYRRGALRLLAYLALLQCAAPDSKGVQLLALAQCLEDPQEHERLLESAGRARESLLRVAQARVAADIDRAGGDANARARARAEAVQLARFARRLESTSSVALSACEAAVFPPAAAFVASEARPASATRIMSFVERETTDISSKVGTADEGATAATGAAGGGAAGPPGSTRTRSITRQGSAGRRFTAPASVSVEEALSGYTWIGSQDGLDGGSADALAAGDADDSNTFDGPCWAELIHRSVYAGSALVKFHSVYAETFLELYLEEEKERARGAESRGTTIIAGDSRPVRALALCLLSLIQRHHDELLCHIGQEGSTGRLSASAAAANRYEIGHPAVVLLQGLTTRNNGVHVRLHSGDSNLTASSSDSSDRRQFAPLIAAMVPDGAPAVRWAGCGSGGTSARATAAARSAAAAASPANIMQTVSGALELLHFAYRVFFGRLDLRRTLARFHIAVIDAAEGALRKFTICLRALTEGRQPRVTSGAPVRAPLAAVDPTDVAVVQLMQQRPAMARLVVDAAHSFATIRALLSGGDDFDNEDMMGNAGHFFVSLASQTAQVHFCSEDVADRENSKPFLRVPKDKLFECEALELVHYVKQATAHFKRERELAGRYFDRIHHLGSARSRSTMSMRECAVANEARLWSSFIHKLSFLAEDVNVVVTGDAFPLPSWWTVMMDARLQRTIADEALQRLGELMKQLTDMLAEPTPRKEGDTGALAWQRDRAFEQHLHLLAQVYGVDVADIDGKVAGLQAAVERAEREAVAAEAGDTRTQAEQKLRLARQHFMAVVKCGWSGFNVRPSADALTTKLLRKQWAGSGVLEFLFYRVLRQLLKDAESPAATREAAASFLCQVAPFVKRKDVAEEHRAAIEAAAAPAGPGVGGRAVPGAEYVDAALAAAAAAAPARQLPPRRGALVPVTKLLKYVQAWNGSIGDHATFAGLWAAMLRLQLALYDAGPEGAEARVAFMESNGFMADGSTVAPFMTDDILGKLGWIRGALQANTSVPLHRTFYVLAARSGAETPASADYAPATRGADMPSCWRLQFNVKTEQETAARDSRHPREFRPILVRGTLRRLSERTTTSNYLLGVVQITHAERVYPLARAPHERAGGEEDDAIRTQWVELAVDRRVDVPFRLNASLFETMGERQPRLGGPVKATLCAGPRLLHGGFEIMARDVQADVNNRAELAHVPGKEALELAQHDGGDEVVQLDGAPELLEFRGEEEGTPLMLHESEQVARIVGKPITPPADGAAAAAGGAGASAGAGALPLPTWHRDGEVGAVAAGPRLWYNVASDKFTGTLLDTNPPSPLRCPLYAAVSLGSSALEDVCHEVTRDGDVAVVELGVSGAQPKECTAAALSRLSLVVALPYWSLVGGPDCLFVIKPEAELEAAGGAGGAEGAAPPRNRITSLKARWLGQLFFRGRSETVLDRVVALWQEAVHRLREAFGRTHARRPLLQRPLLFGENILFALEIPAPGTTTSASAARREVGDALAEDDDETVNSSGSAGAGAGAGARPGAASQLLGTASAHGAVSAAAAPVPPPPHARHLGGVAAEPEVPDAAAFREHLAGLLHRDAEAEAGPVIPNAKICNFGFGCHHLETCALRHWPDIDCKSGEDCELFPQRRCMYLHPQQWQFIVEGDGVRAAGFETLPALEDVVARRNKAKAKAAAAAAAAAGGGAVAGGGKGKAAGPKLAHARGAGADGDWEIAGQGHQAPATKAALAAAAAAAGVGAGAAGRGNAFALLDDEADNSGSALSTPAPTAGASARKAAAAAAATTTPAAGVSAGKVTATAAAIAGAATGKAAGAAAAISAPAAIPAASAAKAAAFSSLGAPIAGPAAGGTAGKAPAAPAGTAPAVGPTTGGVASKLAVVATAGGARAVAGGAGAASPAAAAPATRIPKSQLCPYGFRCKPPKGKTCTLRHWPDRVCDKRNRCDRLDLRSCPYLHPSQEKLAKGDSIPIEAFDALPNRGLLKPSGSFF